MKDSIKKLVLMQFQQRGISDEAYHFLSEKEKALLIEKSGRFFVSDEERKKIKVVLTGGVYDVLHIGHLITLTEAKKHGDLLVVAIANDEHIRKKGREPIHPQEYRKMMTEALKPVDLAISGFDDPKKMVEFVKPDVIVYGYDQKPFLRPDGVEIVQLTKQMDDKKFKTGKIIDALGL
ncbi:adenylyltransferase/cytidyltransferase family protein [Candidatus Micrarchaeota archaeon]|nr:adenylyltransferase/cytidyltransferase family protein [Candidatus Micrarchaeota archaeon]